MVSLDVLQKAPDKPGVYIFKKEKKPLYIGKAKSLRDSFCNIINLRKRIAKKGP